MDPGGTLYLIDTYPKVLGLNLSSIIARRLLDGAGSASVDWVRARSDEAVRSWTAPIDFLFIDGDHSYDAVRTDWEDWHGFVAPDGRVAFHDALLDADWMDSGFGSARFVKELIDAHAGWRLVEGADSIAVFARSGE